MSTVFSDLISMAKEQAEPQRLLFLFAKPESSKSKNNKISRGHLAPIMCVDKLPDEIESFEQFAKEADSIEKSWQFIFVAGLSGQQGKAPTAEAAEPYLNKMTNDLVTGQNIANYVVIDRAGEPIEMMVN